jgi:hypothetical protein
LKRIALRLSLLISLLLLVACTISDEELTKTTIDQTEQAFHTNPKKANEKTELFSYYLPEGFSVKETNEFNVLLEKGNKSYILFVNKNETENSKLSYNALAEQYKQPFISETFENQVRFGYLFVNKLENNMYEVTVGIGGTKVTTESNANDVAEDAENMMNIVVSIQ